MHGIPTYACRADGEDSPFCTMIHYANVRIRVPGVPTVPICSDSLTHWEICVSQQQLLLFQYMQVLPRAGAIQGRYTDNCKVWIHANHFPETDLERYPG